MDKGLFKILGSMSAYASMFPLCVGLYKFKKLNTTQHRIFYLVVALFITEMIALLLWYNAINNQPLYFCYSIIEFVLIVSIYKEKLPDIFPKTVFNSLYITFISFALINVLFFQDIFTFNSNVITVSAILYIILSLVYFYSLLNKSTYTPLEKSPVFWINTGILIGFSSNILVYLVSNNVKLSLNETYTLWGCHAIVNIVFIIFITIALWIYPERT